MTKKEFRIELAVKKLHDDAHGRIRFLTLTTPDICTAREVMYRWRLLVNSIYWRSHKIRYVMVLEKHGGGHGYHIHAVIDKWLDVNIFRHFLNSFGFGRFQLVLVRGKVGRVCQYLAKYVSKSLLRKNAADKYVRFVNVSRGLPVLKDIVVRDTSTDFFHFCLERFDCYVKPFALFHVCNHFWLSDGQVNSSFLHGFRFDDDMIYIISLLWREFSEIKK